MQKRPTAIVSALILVLLCGSASARTSDPEIQQTLIAQSIAGYPGPCPCPYNRARNGSMCGRRSAYSRPGGYAPLCYPADVTPGMIQDYRRTHAER